jgi:hypothetical protein
LAEATLDSGYVFLPDDRQSSPGFRLQVLVEPIKIALVAVADKAGPRDQIGD